SVSKSRFAHHDLAVFFIRNSFLSFRACVDAAEQLHLDSQFVANFLLGLLACVKQVKMVHNKAGQKACAENVALELVAEIVYVSCWKTDTIKLYGKVYQLVGASW